jgi:hypothetical protein
MDLPLTKKAISHQLSAKEKSTGYRDHSHVGCAPRTISWGKNSRGRLFHIYLAKK